MKIEAFWDTAPFKWADVSEARTASIIRARSKPHMKNLAKIWQLVGPMGKGVRKERARETMRERGGHQPGTDAVSLHTS
jgi:hypothetical protein